MTEVNTPAAFIHALGEYAVDSFENDETHSRFFSTREEAMAYLSTLSRSATLRATTLEDVFVTRIAESKRGEKR